MREDRWKEAQGEESKEEEGSQKLLGIRNEFQLQF